MAKKNLSRTTRGNKKELPPHVSIQKYKKADSTIEIYWVVRYRYTVSGQEKVKPRRCKVGSWTDAADVYKALEAEYGNKTPDQIENSKRTFGDLADVYETEYLVPAVRTREGVNEGGLAKTETPLRYLNGHAKLTPEKKALCFGPDLGWRTLIGETTKLQHIDGAFLARLRKRLAQQPALKRVWRVKKGKKERVLIESPRSVKDINLRFGILRHMFNVARKDLKWLKKWEYPFDDSTTPLIKVKAEPWRSRIMSLEEEKLILEFATGPRAHLRLIILGLVNTCMRSTEFYQLKVGDWDRSRRRMNIRHMTTKTKRKRVATVSGRFAEALEEWITDNDLGPDDYIFNLQAIRKVCGDTEVEADPDALHIKSVRKAWNTCKRLTGVASLQDLTLKDLRRTGATRLSQRGKPLAAIAALLGHTDIKMTIRYIGFDQVDLDDLADTQDLMYAEESGRLGPVQNERVN